MNGVIVLLMICDPEDGYGYQEENGTAKNEERGSPASR